MKISNNKLIKIFESEENAKNVLINDNITLTQKEISQKYNVGTDTICTWFKKLGIYTNKEISKHHLSGRKKKKEPNDFITKEYIENLYYKNHMTQNEISKKTGLAKWTVQKLFKKFNIKVRSIKNKTTTIENEDKLNNKEWLYENHVVLKKSMVEIANELCVADVTVARKLLQFHIPKNKCSGNYVWNIFGNEKDLINTISKRIKKESLTEIANSYNIDIATVSLWCKKYNITPKIHYISKEQKEIHNILKQYNIISEVNIRNMLENNLEIDIYIPDKKIGIELNGLYWHSSRYIKNIQYHKIKTDLATKKGIKLFQFYDIEWNNKKNIVLSIILNSLGINTDIIFARKTIIKEITQKIADDFHNTNHLQGTTTSKKHIGLYYNNSLVCVMSFTPSRFDKNIEWELTRFTNKTFTKVIGGASKLLSYFIKKYNPKSIVSYADKRISQGDMYYKLGFMCIKIIRPDYIYIDNNKKIIRKEKMRHSRMNNILENYDSSKTEKENTELHGYHRVYDCGKIKFVWKSVDILK